MKRVFPILIFVYLTSITVNSFSQTYKLVWEDNFDGTTLDSSKWNVEQRVGVWNTGGNQEKQHYRKENVAVGDDGEGHNCMVITAKKESFDGYNFTSGRVNTKGKFACRRGKIEAMIKIPNLANGLWPAFWTLGYTEKGWPDCGEIDILEMGHKAGILADTVNSFIGTHLFWGPYVGNNPPNYGGEFTTSQDLSSGYFKHTIIWDDMYIKTYFNDAATPYFTMDISGAGVEEFRDYMHYLIFNLAVGGSVPGITNEADITAPLPASMYIDWVKVYQEVGSEDYNDSSLALFGSIGVYEETVSSTMAIDLGYDAAIETSGLTERAGETPKEGTNVLSYDATTGNDFKFALNSDFPRNLSKYASGSVQFWFKTQSPDSIMVGVTDTAGHEAFITLKDGVMMNPTRDGEWSFSWIPLSELTGVDLSAIKGFLVVKGNFAQDGYFSLDRIIWSESNFISTDLDYYGIFAEHPDISAKLDFGDGGHIYTWSGFTVSASTPFYGTNVLSYKANTNVWNGFGIQSDNSIDLSTYYDGALHFWYKTSSSGDIEIGFKNSADKGWKKVFSGSSQIIRDGKWHEFQISIKDFTFDNGAFTANDLKDIAIPFYLVGTVEIALDEIYISKNGTALDYPEIPSSIEFTNNSNLINIFPNPVNRLLNIKELEQASKIIVYDQLGNKVLTEELDNGGTIDMSDLSKGVYTIHIKNSQNIKVFQIVKN
jgi:beta-glucanase (GH16 family)